MKTAPAVQQCSAHVLNMYSSLDVTVKQHVSLEEFQEILSKRLDFKSTARRAEELTQRRTSFKWWLHVD